MAKAAKEHFLAELRNRYPGIKRDSASQSLFEIRETSTRIYVRYSKVHAKTRTFFGLRRTDLAWLEGHNGLIAFVWDGQQVPLIVPHSAFEDVFASVPVAQDGQYKVQVLLNPVLTELYIANAGRFNVDGYLGWNELNTPVRDETVAKARSLTHSQVQTLITAIGFAKGNDIWCPTSDRSGLDWNVASKCPLHNVLPPRYKSVEPILSEVDVVWMKRGAGDLVALFEIEHTTSVYSGLLRFNDIHLVAPELKPRFSIVSHDTRRALYVRQINRPTFQRSGLAEICTFMRYENVLEWHSRLNKSEI